MVLNSTAGKAISGTGFQTFFQKDSLDKRPRKRASWLAYVTLFSSISMKEARFSSTLKFFSALGRLP